MALALAHEWLPAWPNGDLLREDRGQGACPVVRVTGPGALVRPTLCGANVHAERTHTSHVICEHTFLFF
jgi:hypothetical protein